MDSTPSAYDRLNLPQRRAVDNTVASYRMEGMILTPGEIDILCRRELGELSLDQATRLMLLVDEDPGPDPREDADAGA